jgi:hypothetical protein
MILNNNTVHEHYTIDGVYKVFIVENVMNYRLIDFNTHHIDVCETKEDPLEYYFVIDLLFHDAFAHWVYESAIYLPIFSKLKEIYPNIKILLKEKKQFKLLFLKFFNITEDNIVYDIHPNNKCLFPSPISPLNDNNITDNYKEIIVKFITIFSKCRNVQPKYDYIILPRQSKENYKHNDRTYDMNVIYDAVSSITNNYTILHTDTIKDLHDQINAIQSASNVIVTDGSPFLVNNLFCNNKKLLVLDTVTQYQSSFLFKQQYIIDTLCKINNNTYTYCPIHTPYHQIIELLHQEYK